MNEDNTPHPIACTLHIGSFYFRSAPIFVVIPMYEVRKGPPPLKIKLACASFKRSLRIGYGESSVLSVGLLGTRLTSQLKKINTMADGGGDNNNNVFVYLGGYQEVVFRGVTHAVIDPSVNIVLGGAFNYCRELVSVIFHDGVERIEGGAFAGCRYLSGRIKLLGVREIGDEAFQFCYNLSDVQFGDRLETIGKYAFDGCSMMSIEIPTVRTLDIEAFSYCEKVEDVEFGVNLETIGIGSFYGCKQLQRIAIPLKDGLFQFDTRQQRYTQFDYCDKLTTVDLVGAEGINNTISSLLIESWRDEMNQEIDRINEELEDTDADEKANAIRLWIRSVINRFDHYKAEHNRLLKEHMTLLELAVWKAKLDEDEKEDSFTQKVQVKRAKIDEESKREEKRITSGADIIIKNVLPFLQLKE